MDQPIFSVKLLLFFKFLLPDKKKHPHLNPLLPREGEEALKQRIIDVNMIYRVKKTLSC
jgi:hypothetical protein